MKKYILALDLGTTGNRAIIFSFKGQIVASSYYEFPQIFPQPGWVEHDPIQIWETTKKTISDVLEKINPDDVEAIGITNQRETAVLWDRKTGVPLHNAIVWQCRRTASICKEYEKSAQLIRNKTGLPLDPYFSATKIVWMLRNIPGIREKSLNGEVCSGTIDSWILWNLTGHKIHATDHSNASRTMLYNLKTNNYDNELLELFDMPAQILPEIKDSAGLFGYSDKKITGKQIPILAVLGDQQASLFSHGGWNNEIIKNTYGTGLFLMCGLGKKIPITSELVTTVGWKYGNKTTYALEGSVFIGGSIIQWLRDGLKLINSAKESEKLATSVKDNENVYLVPALTGLGAPYWDPEARGLIIGLTRSTTKAHIVRSALESIAYQTRDLIILIEKITGQKYKTLRVDGGASKNNFLMQFQSDILGISVERPTIIETTAMGIASLAALQAGILSNEEETKNFIITEHIFVPKMPLEQSITYYNKWLKAIKKAKKWD